MILIKSSANYYTMAFFFVRGVSSGFGKYLSSSSARDFIASGMRTQSLAAGLDIIDRP